MVFFSLEKTDKFSTSWGLALSLVFAGWFGFVTVEFYLERQFRDQNWSTSTLLIDFSGMYFALLVVAIIVSFMVGKGVKKYRTIPNAVLVKKAFWVSAAFLALFTWGDYHAATGANFSSATESTGSRSMRNSDGMAKVTAVITRQRQDGLIALDSGIDDLSIATLEDWLVETIISKLKNQYVEMGIEGRDASKAVQSSSALLNVEGRDLAFIKININDRVRMVAIFGVLHGEVVKVSCFRNSNHEVTVFSGACGDKLHEAFGIRMSP